MEFRKVGGARKYFKYAECDKGQVLIDGGKYLGSKPNKFSGQDHEFEKDGQVTVLNSAGQLNRLVETHLDPGMYAHITYEGKAEIEKGPLKGKSSHQFEMSVANPDNVSAGVAVEEDGQTTLTLDDLD